MHHANAHPLLSRMRKWVFQFESRGISSAAHVLVFFLFLHTRSRVSCFSCEFLTLCSVFIYFPHRARFEFALKDYAPLSVSKNSPILREENLIISECHQIREHKGHAICGNLITPENKYQPSGIISKTSWSDFFQVVYYFESHSENANVVWLKWSDEWLYISLFLILIQLWDLNLTTNVA